MIIVKRAALLPVVQLSNIDDSSFTTSQRQQIFIDTFVAAVAANLPITGKVRIARNLVENFGYLIPEEGFTQDVQAIGQYQVGNNFYAVYTDVNLDDDIIVTE